MDIWKRMYEKAREQYHPEEVSPFIYAHHVVCAIEAENGDIYTGFCIESCSGVMNICADMAAYISVPRDLANVKTKVAFNLTKRQLICFGAAALVGVPRFFVLRDIGGNTAATLGMMIVMLPAFFLGMYQKNGQPAEKLLRYYVQAKFLRPKVRPYKTCNYYSILTKEVTFRDESSEKDR